MTNNTELNILPCLSDSLLLMSSLFSVGEPELVKTGPYSESIMSAVLGAVGYIKVNVQEIWYELSSSSLACAL